MFKNDFNVSLRLENEIFWNVHINYGKNWTFYKKHCFKRIIVVVNSSFRFRILYLLSYACENNLNGFHFLTNIISILTNDWFNTYYIWDKELNEKKNISKLGETENSVLHICDQTKTNNKVSYYLNEFWFRKEPSFLIFHGHIYSVT